MSLELRVYLPSDALLGGRGSKSRPERLDFESVPKRQKAGKPSVPRAPVADSML